MSSTKRVCYACGSKYDYCPRCSEYASQPKWRSMYDTEDCKDIFDAVSGYNMGVYTVDNIKDAVNKHNIKDFSKYKESISKLLNELCNSNSNEYNSYSSKKYKKNKKKDMDIDLKETEENVQEVIKQEEVIEPVSEIKPEQIVEEILNGISKN